jgi:rhodanese-related sulfurtransferase
MVTTIPAHELDSLRKRGEPVTLIDVRTPAEFGEMHVDFARNVPVDRLDPSKLAADHADSTRPIYFICRSGSRSTMASEKMIAAGITNVVSIDGGTQACAEAGLPITRGKKAMSLERQVRIAAGSLVATGAALAAFGPDPLWQNIGAGLAGFVGCGLVFAGVTDTCGMAMIIARMPWNQSPAVCARLLLAVILAAAAGQASAASHTKDSLAAVQQAVAAGQAVIVDVREADEWADGHIAGARLLPLSELEKGIDPARLAQVLPKKDTIIYCHCLAGGRCLEAAAILAPHGYDVRPLKQGYSQLIQAGFPAAVGK